MLPEQDCVGTMSPSVRWPEGKRFAFSVFDDTDMATLENVGGVYDFLGDAGFRTTKSCWAFSGDPTKGKFPGETLDDAPYRRWLVDLQAKGFEIGWHGATWHTSYRDTTAKALERFAEVFGHDPMIGASHTTGEESMYWGDRRLSGSRRWLYNILTHDHNRGRYHGDIEGDPRFWGDLCMKKIKYYRNFVFGDINTLLACPFMPYHNPACPYVNYWFASSDGNRIERYVRCISEAAQDRLEEQGGACIMYTHFSCGFLNGAQLEPRFESLMRRLSRKNGWFVPASTLLDHLLAVRGDREITAAQRRELERRWLRNKLLTGTD
jgi:hypothetical protein